MNTLAELIPLLLEKTIQRKLQWEDLSTGSYIARLGGRNLELSSPKTSRARIALVDDEGRVLESASYESLSGPVDDKLVELLHAARRQALGVDTALRELKNELDKL